MGRPLRCQSPGYYHLTQRGVARELVYLDDADRVAFLRLLRRMIARYGWTLHGYCLMSNHFHLVAELQEPTLARGMQYLTGIYGRRFNERHDRRGHLFQDRYRSAIIESEEHFAQALRYLALNPVRAGLCELPEEWPWGSFAASSDPALQPGPKTQELAQMAVTAPT